MVKFMRSDRITAQGGVTAGLLTGHHAAVTGMCHSKPVMTHLPVKEAAHRHLSRPLAGSLWGKPLPNSSPNVGWPHLPGAASGAAQSCPVTASGRLTTTTAVTNILVLLAGDPRKIGGLYLFGSSQHFSCRCYLHPG